MVKYRQQQHLSHFPMMSFLILSGNPLEAPPGPPRPLENPLLFKNNVTEAKEQRLCYRLQALQESSTKIVSTENIKTQAM